MKTRILLVEDDPNIRDLLRKILGHKPFEFCEAANSEEDLRQLDKGHVDLIMCDLVMPGEGGLTFIERKNSQPAFASIPVIMVTSEGTNDTRQQAEKLGVELWLVKPFKKQAAIAIVDLALEKYLHIRKQA